jgi:hypothetical protein
MKCQRFRWIAVVASLMSVVMLGDLKAQVGMRQPLSYAPQPAAYGVAPQHGAVRTAPGDGVGFSVVAPAHYAGGGEMYLHGPTIMDGSGACGSEECVGLHGGGYGTHRRGRGPGSLLSWLAPYGEGGCCAPHWFDIHAEAVFLKLDNEGRSIVFSRLDGPGGAPQITSAELGFHEEPGMRISAAYQTGPGSNLEFTYLGLMDHVSTTGVESSTNNLFSVFSNFGQPSPQGLQFFDNAFFHQVGHRSRLDSFELNYRRRWIGPTCTIQGSWLAGVRYAQIREKLNFRSNAIVFDPDPVQGEGRYDLDVGNHMTGFQLGGDAWVCILPGLNIGFDGKAGIYGNNANQQTRMSSNDPSTGFRALIDNERVSGEQLSFLGEAAVLGTYRVNHQFTIRGGYQLLYVEGVATAMSNFNATNDTVNAPRTPFLSDNSNRFYHGFTIGAEWMW